MNRWKKLSASVMRGFVVSTADKSPKTKAGRPTSGSLPAGTGEFIVLFGPLTPDVSRKIPLHFKAAHRGATSPSNDERRLQTEALALIAQAIAYIDREAAPISSCSLADYREG